MGATYPLSVEYLDVNGVDPTWSKGWVRLEMAGKPAQQAAASAEDAAV
jgi:hypothetical protein